MSSVSVLRRVPFSRVDCDGNEQQYVREVLESGWLTTAGRAQEFENRFREYVGARYACAVNSCTAALHLALEAVGIGPGDKVLVPTWTFTATAEVVRYLGADPVLTDVDESTALLTPAALRSCLDQHEIKAVIVVHFAGQPAAMTGEKGLVALCRSAGIPLIEDAAHAFPAKEDGRFVGSMGDATCFSFYANKTITTAEGGMLTTNREEVYRRAKVMRLHGIDRDVWDRFTSDKPSWEYDVIAPGFKYNMPDLGAAIGLAQLERADALRAARQRCALRYLRALKEIPCSRLPALRVSPEDHAWHLFWICLTPEAPINRNRLIEELATKGIGTSVHYKPLHRMTYYKDRYCLRPEDFPNAEKLWRGCLSLPLYPGLTDEDQDYVIEALLELLLS